MTDLDHRAYVGPGDQYDLIGGAQFALLYALGLRAHHRLLDIGCGSLRAGRMLIAYLERGRYTGVEPNPWLVRDALDAELGHDVIALKQPHFDETGDFGLVHLGHFDFVLAQGIATNTGPALLAPLLGGIAQTLASGGLAAITVIHPGSGDREAVPVALHDRDAEPWRYPGCYAYTEADVTTAVQAAGLAGRPIDWFHPRHRWWLLAHDAAMLPPDAFLAALTGATLADGCEASWRT
jgi:SAM-dependent methyltransferase